MRKSFLLAAILVFCFLTSPALAQSHSATLNWTLSTTPNISGQNVYRAPCTGTLIAGVCSAEGVFNKIANGLSPTVKTYTDSTVIAGLIYSYYVTANCPATSSGCGPDTNGNPILGESQPSNHIAVSIPGNPVPPNPPTGLSITTVTQNSNGANVTVVASWTDTPSVPTTYTFFSNGVVLATGTLVNGTGNYSTPWNGKLKPGSRVTFEVCDANGCIVQVA